MNSLVFIWPACQRKSSENRVREADIPAYARRHLLQHLGGFRGPSREDFFNEDWHSFLMSLQ